MGGRSSGIASRVRDLVRRPAPSAAPSGGEAAPAPAAAPRSTARVVKKNDGVDYERDVLALFDLELVRMHEATTVDRPRYYIRHDGCGNLDFDDALALARYEAERGYTATYFLLPPGSYDTRPKNYYGHWEDGRIVHDARLADRCKALLDLGHDLGLHSDVVSLALTTGVAPREIFEREVEFFTRHGMRLRGTASHGQPLCRQLSYNNREIFEGCIRAGWEPGRTISHGGRSVQLHSLDMTDFGFEYEAYSLPRDSRLSESGAKWGGRIGGEQLPKDRFATSFDLAEFRAYVERADAAHGVRALQLLTHPCHWRTHG